MSPRWLRLISTIVAIGFAAAIWQMVVLTQTTGRASLLILAIISSASLAGIAAGFVTLAPHAALLRFSDRAARLRSAIRSSEVVDRPLHGRVLIGLGVLAFAAIAGVMLSSPDDPADDDQAAFLATAAEVHDAGGPARLIADLYGGRFAEANRHPLYIALLSWRPSVAFGRGLSAALGAVILLTLVLWTSRLRGSLIAGVVCLLLGTNMAYCEYSTRVVCDVLMVLWGGAPFLLASRTAAKPSRRGDLAMGSVLGLAYLTKGTGQLMLIGVLLWKATLWFWPMSSGSTNDGDPANAPVSSENANGRLTQRGLIRGLVVPVLLMLAAWAVVASPLLVRNVRMYGNATYNVNNWLLFVDAYEPPVPLSQRQTLGEAARAYWESHTLAGIMQREASGLVWETFILLRMLGPFPLDDSRVLFGLPFALCALIGILARPRPEHLLLGYWTVLFVGMFAWYVPIAAGERFLLPLLAPLLICATEGLLRKFRTVGRARL